MAVSEYICSEIIKAKKKEFQNLQDYETFEEVADKGQETMERRWVIPSTKKNNGQKTVLKAKLIAQN